jgi:hypothetical protein
MIVSASYRTDIPTFYGEWFINRLRAGYCMVINPFSRKSYRVSLQRKDVDAFVFWTKNAGPFLPRLTEVRERGFPFILQYTINGYPRELETAVTSRIQSVQHVKRIADEFGPGLVVWRYDTILISSLTDFAFHAKNFASIAKSLAGLVDEVVVSFAQLYKKTERNLDAAARSHVFDWTDPPLNEKRRLLEHLTQVAGTFGIRLAICSQPELLVHGSREARCVDADRISRVIGSSLATKLKGNRAGCGCFESRDIGDYDSCPHGCVYCYAVSNHETVRTRFLTHHPESEFLLPHVGRVDGTAVARRQLPMFDDQG